MDYNLKSYFGKASGTIASILVIFNLSIKLLLPKTRYRCSLQNDDNGNDNGLLYYILVKIAIDNPILIFAIITLC